jgi:hypothetical protein
MMQSTRKVFTVFQSRIGVAHKLRQRMGNRMAGFWSASLEVSAVLGAGMVVTCTGEVCRPTTRFRRGVGRCDSLELRARNPVACNPCWAAHRFKEIHLTDHLRLILGKNCNYDVVSSPSAFRPV